MAKTSLSDWLKSVERRFCSRRYSIPLALLLGLSSYFVFLVWVGLHPAKTTLGTFTADPEVMDAMNAWRPRVLSTFLAETMVQYTGATTHAAVIQCIAAWNAIWLTGSFLVFSFWGYRPLLMLAGLSAGLLYDFTPVQGAYAGALFFYPWDYPVLFFYSMATVLFMKGKTVPLVIVILVGMAFKETVVVLSIFFLGMGPGGIRRRFLTFASVAFACLVIKVALNVWTSSGFFFVFDTVRLSNQTWLPLSNLRSLVDLRWNPAILVNAGTLLVSLCLPIKNQRMVIFKAIVVSFSIGNFLFGVIDEYRIFLEVIPVSLVYILAFAYGPRPSLENPRVPL